MEHIVSSDGVIEEIVGNQGNYNDDDDDEDEEEEQEEEGEEKEKLHMKAYTVSELLDKTKKSEKRRERAGKLKPSRIWSPDGEYTVVRTGHTFIMDPDECKKTLQERSLTIFKHTNPDVKFG